LIFISFLLCHVRGFGRVVFLFCLPFLWWFLIDAVVIHTIKVAFEGIHVSRPEAAELSQPRVHLSKWFWLQPVETALCVHRGFDEPGVAQHSQVL
jgi:hypothetical protein